MPTFRNGGEGKWKMFYKSTIMLPLHNIFPSSSFFPFIQLCMHSGIYSAPDIHVPDTVLCAGGTHKNEAWPQIKVPQQHKWG